MYKNEVEIDVVICTNEVDQILLATLGDILSQSINSLNIFLILDGKDLLGDWLNIKIEDKRISVLVNEKNGLTSGLIYGFGAGKSKFIARADRGDRFSSERFEMQVNLLKKQPKTAVVGCESDLIYLDSSMKVLRTVRSPSFFNKKDIISRNPLIHGSIMIKRKYYDEVGGYDPAISKSQDLDLYLRLQHIADFAIVCPDYHKHFFYISSSSIRKNKVQIIQGIQSRLKYLPIWQQLSPRFLLYLVRSFTLILLPVFILTKIRTLGLDGIFLRQSK